jgi:hypothetical protein
MLNLIGNAVRTKASRDGTQQGTGLSRVATVLKSKRTGGNLVATMQCCNTSQHNPRTHVITRSAGSTHPSHSMTS